MAYTTWYVRSLYRADSVMAVAKEISEHKLDLVGVQDFRWDRDNAERADEYTFCYGKGNENHELGIGFLDITESCQQLIG
jgi:hypothetical protein